MEQMLRWLLLPLLFLSVTANSPNDLASVVQSSNLEDSYFDERKADELFPENNNSSCTIDDWLQDLEESNKTVEKIDGSKNARFSIPGKHCKKLFNPAYDHLTVLEWRGTKEANFLITAESLDSEKCGHGKLRSEGSQETVRNVDGCDATFEGEVEPLQSVTLRWTPPKCGCVVLRAILKTETTDTIQAIGKHDGPFEILACINPYPRPLNGPCVNGDCHFRSGWRGRHHMHNSETTNGEEDEPSTDENPLFPGHSRRSFHHGKPWKKNCRKCKKNQEEGNKPWMHRERNWPEEPSGEEQDGSSEEPNMFDGPTMEGPRWQNSENERRDWMEHREGMGARGMHKRGKHWHMNEDFEEDSLNHAEGEEAEEETGGEPPRGRGMGRRGGWHHGRTWNRGHGKGWRKGHRWSHDEDKFGHIAKHSSPVQSHPYFRGDIHDGRRGHHFRNVHDSPTSANEISEDDQPEEQDTFSNDLDEEPVTPETVVIKPPEDTQNIPEEPVEEVETFSEYEDDYFENEIEAAEEDEEEEENELVEKFLAEELELEEEALAEKNIASDDGPQLGEIAKAQKRKNRKQKNREGRMGAKFCCKQGIRHKKFFNETRETNTTRNICLLNPPEEILSFAEHKFSSPEEQCKQKFTTCCNKFDVQRWLKKQENRNQRIALKMKKKAARKAEKKVSFGSKKVSKKQKKAAKRERKAARKQRKRQHNE